MNGQGQPRTGFSKLYTGQLYSCAKGLFLAKPLLNSERRLPILPPHPGLAKLRAFRAHLGLAVGEAFPSAEAVKSSIPATSKRCSSAPVGPFYSILACRSGSRASRAYRASTVKRWGVASKAGRAPGVY